MWFWQKRKKNQMINKRRQEMLQSLKTLGIESFICQDIPTRTLKEKISETYHRIKKTILSKKIDTIFCPAYEGGHQDHDISNFICSKFLGLCVIKEFPEYNFSNKKINCNTFIVPTKNQKIFQLSNQEKKFKEKCLRIYESEKSNLNYVKTENESYRPIFNYDYSIPPHEGVMFYRRYRLFSWHPRVDGDNPKKICEILKKSQIYKLK